MTINVAVKCPDGIVMGADSLIAVPGTKLGSISALVPYFTKLFPLGRFSAGVMINGAGAIGGLRVEDIILEFGEEYDNRSSSYKLRDISILLSNKIQLIIDDYIKELAKKENVTLETLLSEGRFKGIVPNLEVVVGGYSKGSEARGKRYGEIYSMRWQTSNIQINALQDTKYTPEFLDLYAKDTEFGTHYGGQRWMLDRYLYGIDDYMIKLMHKRRKLLFEDARLYIINQLKNKGVAVPEDITIDVPNDLADFDIYKLVSNYQRQGNIAADGAKEVKKGMIARLETNEGNFSLQTAVDFCNFLLSCAYAESMFTLVIPTVGSEMRIASITRKEGFQLRRQWEIRSPGPPFVDIRK